MPTWGLTAPARATQTKRVKIHINRAGQSLGQFTPAEVRAGFNEGRFTAGDLAWRDGMPMWKPLGEVIDELAPDTESGPPALAPEGAAAAGLPWENRAQTGFFNALFETIRLVLLEPSKAFTAMRPTGGLAAPLFFFVLTGTVGGLAGIIYQMVLNSVQAAGTPEQQAVVAMFASTAVVGMTIMFLPIFFAAIAFVSAGLVHLALMIVGGANRPFEATFRVVCYAGGASAVLQLLPVCGGLVSSVWNFVLMILGLAQVHGIGKGRAAVAVLLPSIVCCGLIFGAVFALIAALGGAEALLQSAK